MTSPAARVAAAGMATRLADHFRAARPGLESGEPAAAVRECLVATLDLADGTAEVIRRAESWAREGMDLGVVLRAYHEAIRDGFERVLGDDCPPETRAGADQVLRLLETVTIATSAAYLDQHRLAARHQHTAAQTLVTALLSGHGHAMLARRTGVEVAAAYQVVALAIPPHPGERDARLHAETVARRKLRRLQSALAPVFGSRALSLLSVDGGTILVPVDDEPAPAMSTDTLDVLAAAASVPLTAAAVAGPTERIPELAAEAGDLLELVRALGRPPGLYRMADVAVEYQMTRPGPAREHLAALLDPLLAHPELLATLREFLDTGLDRKRTAERLRLQPTGIAHRLRRIARLTGLDPAHPAGLARASLALLAHDLGTAARTKEYA